MAKKDHLFLGADFGTQGVRVGLADRQGKLLKTSEVKYPIHFPKPGYAVQDSGNWWAGFRKALKDVMDYCTPEQKKNIQAMAVCATSATVLPVDEQGNALDEAIMWMDVRAKDQEARINATKHPVLKYCGEEVSAEWFNPKALWLKENKREIYDKAYKIVEKIDFINYKLTGNWAASKVNAVCKWNYGEGEWFNDEFMGMRCLEDYTDKIITNVLPMGATVGLLNEDLANEFGLERIPVIQGGIDAHIGMVGMGVVSPGKMAAIMGTSFVQLLFTENDRPMKGIWGPYKGAMIEGLTLLEAGQVSAGSIIKWYQEAFGLTGDDGFQTMMEEAKDVPIGANGLRALDFFQGNRTPYKDSHATGAINGLTLNHKRADIHRAIMEAVALGFKNIVVNFEENGVPIDKVVATGGVTQDKLWMQIIADATGKEFIINENTNNGTILGCCILAATGCGSYDSLEEAAANMVHEKETVKPNLENTKKYEPIFQDYLALYQALKPLQK